MIDQAVARAESKNRHNFCSLESHLKPRQIKGVVAPHIRGIMPW